MITVDSPVNCKIYLKYKNEYNNEIMKELVLTQVFTYKISENKRPVYGFNKMDYEQVVRGKRLVEGVIAIKKSLISDIAKMINVGNPTAKDNLEYSKSKVEYLKRVIENDREIRYQLDDYYQRAMREYETNQNLYINQKHSDILNELPEGVSLILAFGSYMDNETFKKEYQKITSGYEEITPEHIERIIASNSNFVLQDIHFFEKTGEINITKNDIDEVYKFFGKLKLWSDV